MLAGSGLASSNGSAGGVPELAEALSAAFRGIALTGETPVAWVQTDLDDNLRFAPGFVLLTDRRLLSFPAATGGVAAKPSAWLLNAGVSGVAQDHAGLGRLELFEGDARPARWRYTSVQ